MRLVWRCRRCRAVLDVCLDHVNSYPHQESGDCAATCTGTFRHPLGGLFERANHCPLAGQTLLHEHASFTRTT